MSVLVTLDNTGQNASLDLIAAGTRIGDIVRFTCPSLGTNIFAAAFTGTLKVTELVSANSFKFEGYRPDGTSASLALSTAAQSATDLSFSIHRVLTKDEQIDEILKVAASYNHKRMTLCWPPKAIDLVNGEEIEIEGWVIAAAYAGARASYPAQQSFSNLSFAGPYKLKYSNDYFTREQLTRLTNGGVTVFVQDAPGAPIYALRQMTTAKDIFKHAEQSMVAAADKYSLELREVLRPLTGKYNITPNYLKLVAQRVDSYNYTAKSTPYDMCGPLILDAKVISIRARLKGENMDLPPGTTEVEVDIEIAEPGNWINVKVLV